ncbi:RE1 [Symbiodinium sp. KB8]|nr:RE1 [Symbiodinium sp. KB8]
MVMAGIGKSFLFDGQFRPRTLDALLDAGLLSRRTRTATAPSEEKRRPGRPVDVALDLSICPFWKKKCFLHGSAGHGCQRADVARVVDLTCPRNPWQHVTARVADTPTWPPTLVDNFVGSSWVFAGDDAALLCLGTLFMSGDVCQNGSAILAQDSGDMDKEHNSSLVQCAWNGDPAGWTDFVRRVRLLYERTARRKRRQIGPSVVAQLTDKAWTVTQEIDHHKLTRREGAVYLLEFLRDRLGRSPVPDVGIRLEELMIKLRRTPGTSMSSWATQVRQTYKRVQIALHRARVEQKGLQAVGSSLGEGKEKKSSSSPSSPSSFSRRGPSSPTRRASEATQATQDTQEEPQAEAPPPHEDGIPDVDEEHPDLDPGAEPRTGWRPRRRKTAIEDDEDSDDSVAALADLEVWDRYEEGGLSEVLPGEVLGWLLLRRANLPTSARLSIQAAAGNSLLFADVEPAMRSMEDELMGHDEARRSSQPRRRSFWVEDEGEWSLIMAPEEELQEIMAANEVHYVGTRLPNEVYYHHDPEPPFSAEEHGFWHQEEDGAFSFWELAEDGEFYTQDWNGLFWAWSDWEDQTVMASSPAESSKASDEAFSVQDPKSRTFVQARQAVKARNLSRGFYPFNPGIKGKPRFKGKGKGKGRGKSPFPRPATTPVLAATGDVFAQPGDASFTGCFVCGAKDHSWRSCPKRNSSGKGPSKGKPGRSFMIDGVYMIQAADEESPAYASASIPQNDEYTSAASSDYRIASRDSGGAQQRPDRTEFSSVLDFRFGESDSQDAPARIVNEALVVSTSDAFVSGTPEAHPRGHAVVDSGATETVGSLPAIEDLMQFRFELHGRPDVFKISDVPPRRFRFGNGALGFSLSHMLIPQELGDVQVDLGIYSLDVQNVPILLGIRTLRSLKTVIDFQKDVAVFAALNPYVGIPLRRSASGHILVNLSSNWMQDSFSLADPSSAFGVAELSSSEEKEDAIGAVFVIEGDSPDFVHAVGGQNLALQEGSAPAGGEPAPEPDWERIQPADERDIRYRGAPCHGDHEVIFRGNQHAVWTFCQKCGIRMSYIPRMGKTALHRSAGPLIQDVKKIVEETAQKEDLGYNPRLRDTAIGLQAAEASAVKQLEKIRLQKEKIMGVPKTDTDARDSRYPSGDLDRPCSPGSDGSLGGDVSHSWLQAPSEHHLRGAGVFESDTGFEVKHETALREIEDLATLLVQQEAFSFQECEEFLMRLVAAPGAMSFSQRQVLDPQKGNGYSVFGLFSHGHISGLTNKTFQLPCTCKYLNLFGRFQLSQEEATWSSFSLSVNQPVKVHLDANKCPSSHNYSCSFGDYRGGQLWVELSESDLQHPGAIRWRSKANGQRVAGRYYDTKHQFVRFYPKAFHATDRWTGFRVSLTFYTSRLVTQASSVRRKCLQKHGFPLPRSVTSKAESHSYQVQNPDECAPEDEIAVLLTQDDQHRLQDSCREVWDEVDQLVGLHGRESVPVQVVEFGGPIEGDLCPLLEQQGGRGFSASLLHGYDLGTRGGCHRSLLQLAELRPQIAWFNLPKGPEYSPEDSRDLKYRSRFQRQRKVSRNVIAISQAQMKHGEVVWISDKRSRSWSDPYVCSFWQSLGDDQRAFEWKCGDLIVRTTSKTLYLDCSQAVNPRETPAVPLSRLQRSVCSSIMKLRDVSGSDSLTGMSFAVTSQKDPLEGVTKGELESLLDTVQKLHRRFGHPSNSLLLKNLRARGASPKLLAVAAQYKCDQCLENQIKTAAPAASLRREDRLWCSLQIDGFYMRFGNEVFHYLLMVDEASGFCIVEEMLRHSDKEMKHMTTAQVCKVIESRWCQIFGFPAILKLDPEGAFRGLDLGEYCASRGVELGVVPAEYHEAISEVERTIGSIRRKVEAFMRTEQFHPTRAAAQMCAAHNSLARASGYSPIQWAFGRDVSITGHSRERPGEECAQSAMTDPSHVMHDNLMIRTKAEQSFLEYRAKDLTSRALNSKTRPVQSFMPGDLVFYRRMQVPQDRPANEVVDRPRMSIARYYGPARILATETTVDYEDGIRKASAIVWAVCNGRLKKFHQSQVRHASETEKLIAEGSSGAHFPWTFSALTELLDKGAYDDETIPRLRGSRGRSRTPARSRSVPPVSRRRLEPSDAPEPPVPVPFPRSARMPQDENDGEEEMIPVPPDRGDKRPEPEPPEDDDMELLPVPGAHFASASTLDMKRFLREPQYLHEDFIAFHQENEFNAVYQVDRGETSVEEPVVYAVTLDAPASEEEWKTIAKNPKRFMAKSVLKGVEVSYAKLNRQQRQAMDEAMQVEVDNWLKTLAVKAAQHYVPRKELLRMRWVLTFKQASSDVDPEKNVDPTKEKVKAKARIVILGYSDPNLLEASTVSPAMTRLSRQLLLNMASVCHWEIQCGDVKSAFLQAKSPQENRGIFATPVGELSKALGLREGQAVQLLKSCYGLVSAPREWYNDVHKTLTSLGAERLVSDSCVWRVRDQSGKVVGLISSHVDDFLVVGQASSNVWQTFIHNFKKSYEWSPWESGSFKHCGIQLLQHPDFSITLDHSAFCGELKQMAPIKESRTLTESEIGQVRAILGSVQWRVYQSAPQHAAKLSYLQSLIACKDSSIVDQVNKLIREVYASRSVSVQVQALGASSPDQLCLVAWSDASLANRPDLSSTGGHLVGLMNQKAFDSGVGKVNPVSWKSGKLHRVARSSLSSEAQALADTEQELFYARLEWREMQGDIVNPLHSEDISAKVSGYLIVDAKAMFDTLSKGVFVASQRDKYTGLELLAVSQRLEAQKTNLLWCDSDHQLADGLTKSSKQDVLKRFLSYGSWRIRYDGAYISAKKRRMMNKEAEEPEDSTFLQFLFSANTKSFRHHPLGCVRGHVQ